MIYSSLDDIFSFFFAKIASDRQLDRRTTRFSICLSNKKKARQKTFPVLCGDSRRSASLGSLAWSFLFSFWTRFFSPCRVVVADQGAIRSSDVLFVGADPAPPSSRPPPVLPRNSNRCSVTEAVLGDETRSNTRGKKSALGVRHRPREGRGGGGG